MIYEPAEDSYLLATCVKKHAHGSVLDIGTGSGIQAITAASLKSVKKVFAVDIQDDVIAELKKKQKAKKINKKITIQKSNLFSNTPGRYDVIIFNPPYLPLDTREPMDSRLTTTGGKHGYETTQQFLLSLDEHLTKNGCCLLLFSSLTNKEKVDEIIAQIGYVSQELAHQAVGGFETLFVYKLTRSDVLQSLFEKGITAVTPLKKGHRGMVFTGIYKKKKVAIKVQRNDVYMKTINREPQMIALLNKHGIGPELLLKGDNYFVYSFVEGEQISDYLKHSSKQETKKLFLEGLRQCRVLDVLKITKEEMHNPYKHILVGKSVVMIDFERAHKNPFPQNVTQFCQYIIRNQQVLESKGIHFKKEILMMLAKEYKHTQTELEYKKIKSLILAF